VLVLPVLLLVLPELPFLALLQLALPGQLQVLTAWTRRQLLQRLLHRPYH
jgi:hypothetical protein